MFPFYFAGFCRVPEALWNLRDAAAAAPRAWPMARCGEFGSSIGEHYAGRRLSDVAGVCAG